MDNKPEVQVKAQFDAISEKQIRENFQSFAKLVGQMVDMKEISQEFLVEIEDCTTCLGGILMLHSDQFAEFREEGKK